MDCSYQLFILLTFNLQHVCGWPDKQIVSDREKGRLGSSAWAKGKGVDGLSLRGSVETVLWKFEVRPSNEM